MVGRYIVHIAVFFQLSNSLLVEETRFLENEERDFIQISEEESDFINRGSFDLSLQTQNTENGTVIIPWINTHMGMPRTAAPSLPVCYNRAQKDLIVRLAYVICRQAGFMVATKWFGVSKETVGLHANSTGLTGYCRGDEQLVTQCQWKYRNFAFCSLFLAIQCGDCSHSFLMAEESRIVLFSPGFPVYIPLVVCEWNITLLPENNLLIRFQQFELPSPVYDESVNAVSCRSGSLDVMSWHEDINKMALDGRFCGRYSPGNLTIFSSRILIRFTAGSFKMDTVTRKGLFAECSVVPLAQLSGHIAIVRWVLVGCAIFFTILTALFFWFWKGNLHSLQQRFCSCWTIPLPIAEGHPNLPVSPMSPVLPSSLTTFNRIPGVEEQRIESIYHRRPSGIKAPVEHCDSRHWEQTRRLEKWRSAHRAPHHPTGNFISMQKLSSPTKEKDESHVYEEIDIGLQNEKHEKTCCTVLSCNHAVSLAPRIMSFVNHSPLYERPRHIIPYQQIPSSGQLCASIVRPESQVNLEYLPSSYVEHRHLQDHISPSLHFSRSLLSTASYFPQSSDSGDSASISGIYICPEPDSEE